MMDLEKDVELFTDSMYVIIGYCRECQDICDYTHFDAKPQDPDVVCGDCGTALSATSMGIVDVPAKNQLSNHK